MRATVSVGLARNATALKAALVCVVAIAAGVLAVQFAMPEIIYGIEATVSGQRITALPFIALAAAIPRFFSHGASSPLTKPDDGAHLQKAGESQTIAKPLLVMLALITAIGATGVQLYHRKELMRGARGRATSR